jgi:hypothetical protein
MRTAMPLAVLAAALTCSFASAPAYARARTFVASYGSDSNPCTFGSPCKTFQHAVDVVDAGGEVTAIDSAGFGPISISKSVTITSPTGVEAGIAAPAPGAAAITINTPSSNVIVTLSGLTLDGANVSNSTGISFGGNGGRLNVRDCVIRNFGQDGIDFSGAGGGVLSVSNTVVSDNGNSGIAYFPSGVISSSAFASIILNRVEIRNNINYGFFLWGGQSTPANLQVQIIANVLESTVSGGLYGFYALSADGHTQPIMHLFHSVVTGAAVGLRAESNGYVEAASSMVTGNGKDWEEVNGGGVLSAGDNRIVDNVTSSGLPTNTGLQ